MLICAHPYSLSSELPPFTVWNSDLIKNISHSLPHSATSVLLSVPCGILQYVSLCGWFHAWHNRCQPLFLCVCPWHISLSCSPLGPQALQLLCIALWCTLCLEDPHFQLWDEGTGSSSTSVFHFWRELQHLTFPPAVQKWPSFFTSPPALAVLVLWFSQQPS